MSQANHCPGCGKPLAPGAPLGLCPRCLLQQGLAASGGDAVGSQPRFSEVTISLEPASSSVLARIAESIGGIPHVLLRDTDIETGPGPILKPYSPELPGPAERPDRYQLFGEIARGGMGAVLKGRDVDLGRDLAVKVLLESHRDKPELVRRFVEEAQIGGQLQHPGIVPVYELGAFSDRRPFFTMKLVKGRTLADLLRARKSPAEELSRFLNIFESIAQTMAYAHVRGVIHRDLKPSNVMVGSFGEVQVMDWGLAKVLPQGGTSADQPASRAEPEPPVSVIRTARSDSESDASQAGSILGTPGYMSPEQARGEIELVDERADVFGLGAILCEILTGEPAFTGRSPSETMRKAGRGELAEAFARLDAHADEPELIELARHCLAPEREDRLPHAGAVAERITGYLSSVQDRLRRAELERVKAEARTVEERKRRRLTVALAACILALVTLGGGVAAWEIQQRQARLNAVETTLARIQTLRDQAAADGSDSARWETVLAASDQALATIGPLVASVPGRSLMALRATIADDQQQAGRDKNLLDELTSIRTSVAKNCCDLKPSDWDRRFMAAFKRHKIDIDAPTTEDAIARLKTRPRAFVREVVGSLDHWLIFRQDLALEAPDEAARRGKVQRLLDLLAGLDPDPERGRLRSFLGSFDLKPNRDALRAIARRANVIEFGPSTALLLAKALTNAEDAETATSVLRTAVVRYPEDAWINVELAGLLKGEEAVRYYTVARALRPETGEDLAQSLRAAGHDDESEALLRELARREPETTRILFELSRLLANRGKREEARSVVDRMLAPFRERLRRKPDDASTYRKIALLLAMTGDRAGAIETYRIAARIDPRSALIRRELGLFLAKQGDQPGAIAALREAIRLVPSDIESHYILATELGLAGDREGEINELRVAIRLQSLSGKGGREPVQTSDESAFDDETLDSYWDGFHAGTRGSFAYDDAGFLGLGIALAETNDWSGATSAFNEAIRLGETSNNGSGTQATIYDYLGNARRLADDLPGAISAYREAIRLEPDQTIESRYPLGLTLAETGDLAAAIDTFRRAIEHDSKRIGPFRILRTITMSPRPSDAIVALRRIREKAADDRVLADAIDLGIRQHEQLTRAVAAIPRIFRLSVRGSEVPEHYHYRGYYASATAIWAAGFDTDPELAKDMKAQNRYNAACSAALAGAGKGIDQPSLDERAKAGWRKRALDWLKADLVHWNKEARSSIPEDRAKVAKTLQHWQADSDLAGIRDEEALKALSEDERKGWRTLWAEVDELLKAASKP